MTWAIAAVVVLVGLTVAIAIAVGYSAGAERAHAKAWGEGYRAAKAELQGRPVSDAAYFKGATERKPYDREGR